MVGSLVVIYPTPHEGGELVLRHKDQEWKFDANTLTASKSSPSLAYVAFYSDIEHEVLKVTSGRRVTVTYNLYLVDPALRPEGPAVTPNTQSVSKLRTTLQGLLESPEFLPDGGLLGFGLAHLYPVTFDTNLREMTGYLKGEDAHVYRACRELQLQPSLRVIYDDNRHGMGYGIMVDKIASNPYYDYEDGSYEGTLIKDLGGVGVNKTEDLDFNRNRYLEEDEGEGELITWISPFNGRNRSQDINMAYGNEFSADYIYCSPCIIVRVAAAADRVSP